MLTEECVFPTRIPAGATTLRRDCDLLRSVTNTSDKLNSVCIRIGTELVWSAVMHDRCTMQLLGDLGIPVIKTQFHDTHILCEHDIDIQSVNLPLQKRRELAQMEPVHSGNIAFVAGEAMNMSGTARKTSRHAIIQPHHSRCDAPMWTSPVVATPSARRPERRDCVRRTVCRSCPGSRAHSSSSERP
jgi:hypothetical protein